MMVCRGFGNIVVYLDDFLYVDSSFETCCSALSTLHKLVRKLGFAVNYNKMVDPTQCLTFLGIQLCSKTCTLSLPVDKLQTLKDELSLFVTRNRVSKKQLMRLNGLLNWAAGVVYGGRVYLRRLIYLCNTLKNKSDRTKLSAEAKLDLLWWRSFMDRFNGRAKCLDPVPVTSVYTDACKDGGGGVFLGDWFYCNWLSDWPKVAGLHINNLEILAILLAAWRWAPFWEGKHVIIMSDNITAIAAINKGKCNNVNIMQGIRHLFWLSVQYNFKITARYIPGVKNVAADAASRILEPGKLQLLKSYVNTDFAWYNMSLDSYILFCRWQGKMVATA